MKTEFEAKFYPVNKEDIRQKLREVGAKLVHPEALMPIVLFTNRANDFKNIHYIRVRDEFGIIKLATKKHARVGEAIDQQKELEVEVSDFQTTVELISSTGLVADAYQEKYREVWELKGAEIVIDTWPELPTYIEIEADSEAAVRDIAEKLGFQWSEAIFTSVFEVYMREHNLSKEEAEAKLKNWRFK